ncbi:MAG: molybdenum cofactor guanylyltransferase [Planctomycetaceae bacterium]
MTKSKTAALVLCGGRSQRMGQPKYLLPFGQQCLLQRIVDVVTTVCDVVGVVAAVNQPMPTLSEDVRIFRDEQPDLGPLSGIATGVTQLSSEADAVFVSSCDAPFLEAAYVQGLISEVGNHDIAIVKGEKHFHPMGAVYRTRIAPIVRQLVDDEQLRPIFLLDKCNANVVEADSMRRYDPELRSLQNMNTPEDYRAALKTAGLPLPDQPE